MKVHFYPVGQIPREQLIFSVIAARMDGRWLLARHRDRDTWELPGGHIEQGETPDDAAVRELYEETGASGGMTRICDYGVERDGAVRCGALFLCNVEGTDPLSSGSEMAETGLFAHLPENLTYPDIQTHLFNRVQGYLNTITAPDEIWDILDENKQPTGRTHRRGDPMQAGDYHLVVDVWMKRADGKYLLTQRAPTKGYALMWESTGGSAASGEDSLTAALREAREEAGMVLDPRKGRMVYTYRARDHFKDVWLFDHEAELSDVMLQEGETVDCHLATREEILQLYHDKELVPYTYLDQLFVEPSSGSFLGLSAPNPDKGHDAP